MRRSALDAGPYYKQAFSVRNNVFDAFRTGKPCSWYKICCHHNPALICERSSAGYELFSFDISSLKDNTYSITFVTEEYVDGVLVHDSSRDDFQITVTNRKRISDFPEEDQKKILMGNSAYDAENDIYKLAWYVIDAKSAAGLLED